MEKEVQRLLESSQPLDAMGKVGHLLQSVSPLFSLFFILLSSGNQCDQQHCEAVLTRNSVRAMMWAGPNLENSRQECSSNSSGFSIVVKVAE
eukprot:4909599-Amphidinium_carterae.1